jgi:hypothetical protein
MTSSMAAPLLLLTVLLAAACGPREVKRTTKCHIAPTSPVTTTSTVLAMAVCVGSDTDAKLLFGGCSPEENASDITVTVNGPALSAAAWECEWRYGSGVANETPRRRFEAYVCCDQTAD